MVFEIIALQTLAPRKRTYDDDGFCLLAYRFICLVGSVKDGPASSGCYFIQRLSILYTL